MTTPRKTFEQYHIHLPLTTEDDKYTSPETQAAWRTWRACRDAAMLRAKKTEAHYISVGNPSKAHAAATVRAGLSKYI